MTIDPTPIRIVELLPPPLLVAVVSYRGMVIETPFDQEADTPADLAPTVERMWNNLTAHEQLRCISRAARQRTA